MKNVQPNWSLHFLSGSSTSTLKNGATWNEKCKKLVLKGGGKSEINDELPFYSVVRRTRQTSVISLLSRHCPFVPHYLWQQRSLFMVSSHRGPFAGDATYVPYPRRSADPWDPSSQFIRQSNLFEYFIWFSSCCPFQMISSDGRLSFTTKPCRVNSIWTRACYIIHNHNCNHRLLVKEQTTDKCLMKFLESNLLFWSNNGRWGCWTVTGLRVYQDDIQVWHAAQCEVH